MDGHLLSALPPLTLVAPLALGVWVYRVPLWGTALRSTFDDLFALPNLLYVGDLVAAPDGLQ